MKRSDHPNCAAKRNQDLGASALRGFRSSAPPVGAWQTGGDTVERSRAPLRDSLHPSNLPLPSGAPPGDPSSNLRLTCVLRRSPRRRPPDHSCYAEQRDLGLHLARAPTTTLDQEKEATAAAAAPERGSENQDQTLAAGEAPFGPAPLPGAPRSPPRPFPRAPPARPTVACGRTSTKSSFTLRDSEKGGVASGGPGNSSAALPAGSPPPALATSRSSRSSFRCLRGRRRRLERRGRAGRGGAAKITYPAPGAWPRWLGPGAETPGCPHP